MHGIRWTEFRGQGFFCRDGMLELWLALVVDEVDRRRSAEAVAPWLLGLRDDWHAQATVSFEGLIETKLDAHVDDESRRQAFVALCRGVRGRIARGEPVSHGLSARVGAGKLEREGAAAGLLRVADAFLWLLDAQAA